MSHIPPHLRLNLPKAQSSPSSPDENNNEITNQTSSLPSLHSSTTQHSTTHSTHLSANPSPTLLELSQDYGIQQNFYKKTLIYHPFTSSHAHSFTPINIPFQFLTQSTQDIPLLPYTRKFDSMRHYIVFWSHYVMRQLKHVFMNVLSSYAHAMASLQNVQQDDAGIEAIPMHWRTTFYASQVNVTNVTPSWMPRDEATLAPNEWYGCRLYKMRLDSDATTTGEFLSTDSNTKLFFQHARRYSVLLINHEYTGIFLEKLPNNEFIIATMSTDMKQHRNEIKILCPGELARHFYRFDTLQGLDKLKPEQQNVLINADQHAFDKYIYERGSFRYKSRHVRHKYFKNKHHLPQSMSEFVERNFCDDEQTALMNFYKGTGIRLIQTVAGCRVSRLLLGMFCLVQRRIKRRVLVVANETLIADCLQRIDSAGIFDGRNTDTKDYSIFSFGRHRDDPRQVQKYAFDHLTRETLQQTHAEIVKKYSSTISRIKEQLDKAQARSKRNQQSIDYLTAQYAAEKGKLQKELAQVDIKSVRRQLMSAPNLIAFVPAKYIQGLTEDLRDIDFLIVTENTHELEAVQLLSRFSSCELAVFLVDLLYAPDDTIYDTTLVERLDANDFPIFTVQMQYLYHPSLGRLLNFFYPGIESHGRIEAEGSDVYKSDFTPFAMYNTVGQTEVVSHAECRNEREARFIKNILGIVRKRLVNDEKKRLWTHRVIILTPFKAQKALIAEHIQEVGGGAIQVGTPEEFRHMSADIVIYSAVLSTGTPEHFKDRLLRASRRVGRAIPVARFSFIAVGDVEWLCTYGGKVWNYLRKIDQEKKDS